MHELSIAMSILDLVAEQAERRGVEVLSVRVKVGPLSGVVPEALRSAYEMARELSAVPNARLMIEQTPLLIHCPECEADRPAVSIQQLCCPICGTPAVGVVSGRELEVVALEVSDDCANTVH